jgi:hypothetical protein
MVTYLNDIDALSIYNGEEYVTNRPIQVFAGTAARGSAIPTPVEGMVTYLEDSNTFQYWDSDSWDNLAPDAPSGNAIINGAFDIWQRGTSFSSGSNAVTYTADRWAVINGAAPTGDYSVSQQTFTPGEAPVAGYEGRFFLRYVCTTAGGSFFQGMVQKIEDVRSFAGETVTLSFWAKADASRTITPRLSQDFGSGGSTAVSIDGAVINVTTSWVRYTRTYNLASISGKTIGTNSSIELFLLASDAAQTIDIWGVQLEAGPVATPFRRNANSLQGELAACQRYFYQHVAGNDKAISLGSQLNATTAIAYIDFPVTMRGNPVLEASSGTNFYRFERSAATDDFNSFTISRPTLTGAVIFNNSEISGTTGVAGVMYTINASASISFSSEL